MQISKKVASIGFPKTDQLTRIGTQLAAQGKPVITLSVGQPDFQMPDYIKEALLSTWGNEDFDHYGSTQGLAELREIIAHKHNKEDNLELDLNDIYICNGAKNGIYSSLQSLINPDDEVMILAPYWVSYIDQVTLAGGKPVIIPSYSENNYKVTLKDLDTNLSEKTKILILNTPNNPSGYYYTFDELKVIFDWSVRHDITIIEDSVYSRLTYDCYKSPTLAILDPKFKNTIIIGGLSKTYAMPGWRLGYVITNPETLDAIHKFGSQSIEHPSLISQYAGYLAMKNEKEEVEEMKKKFTLRRDKAYELISEIPGFKLLEKPSSAFYLFPDINEALRLCNIETVEEFVMEFLTNYYVVTVPGSAYGIKNSLRFSYSIDEEKFEEAIRRLNEFIKIKSKQASNG